MKMTYMRSNWKDEGRFAQLTKTMTCSAASDGVVVTGAVPSSSPPPPPMASSAASAGTRSTDRRDKCLDDGAGGMGR